MPAALVENEEILHDSFAALSFKLIKISKASSSEIIHIYAHTDRDRGGGG